MAICNIKEEEVIDMDEVLDGDEGSDVYDAQMGASNSGYPYFIWDSMVYIVGDMHSNYEPIKTGFTFEDLVR